MDDETTPQKLQPALSRHSCVLCLFLCWPLLVGALAAPAPLWGQAAAEDGSACVVLVIEGSVEMLGAGKREWSPARTNEVLKVGQSLRTGARSRATIRLSDRSVLRLNELTTVDFLAARQKAGTSFLDFKSGSGYFFSRTKPMDTQFRTPLVVGAIRGTEFNLEVAGEGRTTVSLLDGEISLNNQLGEETLHSGDQGVVESGQAPRKTALLEAANIIQWALYYPGILDPSELGLSEESRNGLTQSLAKYQAGDLLGALNSYPPGRAPGSDAERVFYGALLLSVGQVQAAEQQLQNLQPPGSALAGALRSLIATVKGRPVTPSARPVSATEWMAESYRLQSQSKIVEAWQAALNAVQRSPEFGFGWVRVAELQFSQGHLLKAKEALAKGLALSPRNAQAVTLKGFLLAADNRTPEAIDAFNEAIGLDGALGDAWLGRGLCRMREGNWPVSSLATRAKEAGRQDLQVAAALEPNRSALRSYLGKGWYETHDPMRARKDLRLAKQLDPKDPTPWLYSALLDQQNNQINEAVGDLEKSKSLNNNRSLYRSKLLLDQDQAVRSVNLARIYQDDGMDQLSAREAARAVGYDYGNYSAHLFLANSYDALRDPKQINLRYETPWFSELLLANLLAPVGAGSLSQNISQQEYSRLFDGNHLGFGGGAEYFSHGDWSLYGSQYGVIDNSSYAVDAYDRSDHGFRPNNDARELDLSAKFKQQLTPEDSVFLQALYMNYKAGDVRQYYDQNGLTPSQPVPSKTLRVSETQDPNVFFGYHHQWSPGVHTLFLFGRLQDTLTQDDPSASFLIATKDTNGAIRFVNQRPGNFSYKSDLSAYSGEAQQIFQREAHTLVLGARYQDGDVDTHSIITRSKTTDQSVSLDLERASGYAYYSWQVADPLQLSAGLVYDYLRYPQNEEIPPISKGQLHKNHWSPKAGFRWEPAQDTTVRGIYSRSLGGVFYDTSIRLEPTQIAGFNQAFRSILPESIAGLVPGSEFETGGLALDHKFHTQTYFSAAGEILTSHGSRTVGTLDAFGPLLTDIPSGVEQTLNYEEKSLTITLNQLLSKQFALGASYHLSQGDLKDRVPAVPAASSASFSSTANRDVSALLHQLNLYALVNLPCGFFSRVESIWSSQENHGYASPLPGDDFWQFNAYVGYRFPRRLAEIRLGLLNMTDRDYKLNPLNLYSELPRQRMLAVSCKFNF